MIVERQNNEILIRFSAKLEASKIQSILDYLKYEGLTSKSKATKKDMDILLKEVKEGRWEKKKLALRTKIFLIPKFATNCLFHSK